MKWNWDYVDQGRISNAHKVKIASLDINSADPSAECIGSSGKHYFCTLNGCTCPDFSINEKKGQRQPCKHMIALGMKCNLLNDKGLTVEQDCALTTFETSMKVAIAAGFYHVIKKPVVSDNVYDALKWELWDWCGWVEEDEVRADDWELNKDEKAVFDMPLDDFQLYVKRTVERYCMDEMILDLKQDTELNSTNK